MSESSAPESHRRDDETTPESQHDDQPGSDESDDAVEQQVESHLEDFVGEGPAGDERPGRLMSNDQSATTSGEGTTCPK